MYQTSTKVKIQGTTYTVDYPNVGQQLDIESMKSNLSGGKYGSIIRNNTSTAIKLLDLIDALSYFIVLIPDIRKKYEKRAFETIDIKEQFSLTKPFVKFYNEFILKVEEELSKEVDLDEGAVAKSENLTNQE